VATESGTKKVRNASAHKGSAAGPTAAATASQRRPTIITIA
jgi:hypothetical protein